MSMRPHVESIYDRLIQAQKETLVVLMTDGRPHFVEMNQTRPPESHWEGKREMNRYMDKGRWQTTGSGFQRLQEWVEIHWNPEDEKKAPRGTVTAEEDWGRQGQIQLDPVSATRKLISAAKLYGAKLVGKHAAEFAAHGMIEVRRIYLLKGPSIETTKPLDEYCSLLPYSKALQRLEADWDPEDISINLPYPHMDNVCALEGRYFERESCREERYRQYMSPLLKDGPLQLALLLGLVWGNGFRVFGSWHYVPTPAVAALPYRHTTSGRGLGCEYVELALQGYRPWLRKRPLSVPELRDLAMKFSRTPEPTQCRITRAMARLRNSAERIDATDKVIDIGVALDILFIEENEKADWPTLVPGRAAWCYADSEDEKRQTEDMLHRFYYHYSDALHGRALEGDYERNATLLADAENMLRACLKTLIADGWPQDWNEAMEQSALRIDPPRTEAEIPSVKSDSLSWSVEEQKEIDRTLDAVWKPVVEEAPPPPSNVSPSMISSLARKRVERYREQGIPYVVVHPARLYMVHPKWPKTSSEPLDERTRYYCERDVERHTRQWKEAAESKGLIQFEVPTDADAYHPKHRNDWPQPLLSSHEKDPHVRNTTGKMEAYYGTTAAGKTEHRPHVTTDEKPVTPPPELSKSTVSAFEEGWRRLWNAFQHDVYVATESLFYMLEGIHAKHLAERRRLLHTMSMSGDEVKTMEDVVRTSGDFYFIPAYPNLRASLSLTGEPLFERTAPDGPMEQAVFKGWVSEVYDRWESHYRTQLKHETRMLPGAIRPRQQVLGDLRHIRNNLLHNGVARQGEAASCVILRWFTDHESMQVRLRHVFDFLNQMGWLNEGISVILEGQKKMSGWYINREAGPGKPTPALISVRPLTSPEQQDPRYRYGASIVFEDGLFGLIPMGPEREETEVQAKDRELKWMKMRVNERGDLCVPGFGTSPAAALYRNILNEERRPGPGIWRPPVQFRE